MNNGIRYRQQLKRCGFRSYRSANERRADLINIKHNHPTMITPALEAELTALKKLADLYLSWKMRLSRDADRRMFRKIENKIGFFL